MAQIIDFVRPDYPFDREAAAVLVVAYDQAIFGPHDKGQPGAIRELVAKRITELAAAGERDPNKLSQVASRALNIALGIRAADSQRVGGMALRGKGRKAHNGWSCLKVR